MFEERLKRLREARGMTRKEVADKLSLNLRTYISYENNERETNSEVLVKLSKLFGVTTDYLLGNTSLSDNEVFSLQEKNIIKFYRNLNEDGKKMADTYVKDLTENPKYTNDKSTVNPENLTTADIVQMFRDAAKNTAQVAAFGGQGVTTVKQDLSDDEIRALIDELRDK